jgi:hypothetical protein
VPCSKGAGRTGRDIRINTFVEQRKEWVGLFLVRND